MVEADVGAAADHRQGFARRRDRAGIHLGVRSRLAAGAARRERRECKRGGDADDAPPRQLSADRARSPRRSSPCRHAAGPPLGELDEHGWWSLAAEAASTATLRRRPRRSLVAKMKSHANASGHWSRSWTPRVGGCAAPG
jgi:hypothetical protein